MYPDVPTLKELGYDVTHSIWHTLMVPAGTPPDVVAKMRLGLKGMVDDEASSPCWRSWESGPST